MRKKILSAFMLGAFVVAATSTVTSCKDYDGDIKSLQDQVNKNAQALTEAKQALEAEISALKSQLENVKSKHDQDVADLRKADEENKKSIADEVLRATAAEAALETRIGKAEATLDELKKLIDKKVDKETFDEAVKGIYESLETLENNLGSALTRIEGLEGGLKDEVAAREAAVDNLQLQIDALNLYKTRVEKNEADILALKGDAKAHTEKIEKLVSELAAAKEDIAANKASISELTSKMNTLNKTVESVLSDVALLKVLVNQSLRALVFEPTAYYWGVEATESKNLEYSKWALDAANADKAESAYSERVTYTSASTNLPVVAKYFMNPSSAKIDVSKVSVISDDKAYVRGAAAGLSVKKAEVKEGMLNVTLKFADPAKVKNVKEDEAITVFATQVNVAQQDKDTTITSDFAAIYTSAIKDPKIAVIDPVDPADPSCGLAPCAQLHKHMHIYATEEAAAKADAQYKVKYDGTIDLAELVETHVTKDGKEVLFADAKDYGLEYKFELVGYFVGDNNTSESAHAAIKGSVLKAQMPKFSEGHIEGTAAGYGETEVSETEIGRTPMVRVSLVDVNNNNAVVDYGYIKLEITEKDPVAPEDVPFAEVTMKDFAPITYNYECHPADFNGTLTWAQVEKALYNLYGLSRDDFDGAFESDVENGEYVQYAKKGNAYEKIADGKTIGTVSPNANLGSAATDVATWTIESDDLKKLLAVENPASKFTVAIRYASKDTKKYGDIYVNLSTGAITVNKPSATGLVDSNKIKENWYAKNGQTAGSGYHEVHAQTLNPDDANAPEVAVDLNYNIYNVFVGNKITITGINDKTAGREFADTKLTKTVKFSKENVGVVCKGTVDGKDHSYTLGISSDALELTVTHEDGVILNAVPIAKIVDKTVEYMHGDIAEGILNYKAHNELADDVLSAIMEVEASNECFTLPLENKTWNVRFLRPINVFGANASVTDAGTEPQVIKLVDLVKFTDWRDQWKNNKYYAFYNIQKIEVLGASDGDNIASYVTTNLSDGDLEKTMLSDVTTKIKLAYAPKTVTSNQTNGSDYGTITYENHGNTVGSFDIRIPVKVTYEWGAVVEFITLHVNGTIGNGNSAK